jgi:tetrahydromethanopterin S-methyltransferase subunit E
MGHDVIEKIEKKLKAERNQVDANTMAYITRIIAKAVETGEPQSLGTYMCVDVWVVRGSGAES